jgi:hypothetical protein
MDGRTIVPIETRSRGAHSDALPNAAVISRVLSTYLPLILAQIDAACVETVVYRRLGVEREFNVNSNLPGRLVNERELLDSIRKYVKNTINVFIE